jgi:hemolysin activation/secretion protein
VVEESLAAVDIRSRTSGGEIGASQALVDTLARRVELGLAFGRRTSATTLLGLPYSFTAGETNGVSEVRSWRFSQDWTERWETAALAVRSLLAFGTNNVDASSALAQAIPATLVPERRYMVWTGQAQHVDTALGFAGELRLRGSAQYTAQHLLPLEQFASGGVGSVRGYRENAILRDRGFSASVEYRYPLRPISEDGQRLTLLSFIDLGGGANTHAPWQSLSSAGAGLSWQSGGLSAELSYARRISRLANPTSGNLQDRGIQFQLGYRAL